MSHILQFVARAGNGSLLNDGTCPRDLMAMLLRHTAAAGAPASTVLALYMWVLTELLVKRAAFGDLVHQGLQAHERLTVARAPHHVLHTHLLQLAHDLADFARS